MKNVDRRGFLKGSAGVGIGGLIALETLEGCSPSAPVIGNAQFADARDAFPLAFTEENVPTTCWIGKQDCGMVARVVTHEVDGQEFKRVIKFEGHPDNPLNKGTLCPKGAGQIGAVYDYNRVKKPLLRTNAKGRIGAFKEITWDEALSLIGTKLADAKAKETPILWQKGRSKAKGFYDNAFIHALEEGGYDVTKIGHGAFCSDAGYRACEYTVGFHGVLHPDFNHTEYLLSWGWNLTGAGGNKTCWLTWPQKFIEAREKGILKKVVAFDPNRRPTGPHADEWVPPKPGTDLAFFLGIAKYLMDNKHLDEPYLRSVTNAPFLVDVATGDLVEDDTGEVDDEGAPILKARVWDTASDSLKFHDETGITPHLFLTTAEIGAGGIDIRGDGSVMASTGMQLLSDHLATYTPKWADETCDLPAGTTARIAREMYEHAHIGETITIDGVTMPYRPVAIMAYHVSQQEKGFDAVRCSLLVTMLLGAYGVPGGTLTDYAKTEQYSKYATKTSVKDPDYDWKLGNSKFFPITTTNPSFLANVMLDPAAYDVDDSSLPKICFLHMANPMVSFADTLKLGQAYSKFDFCVDVNPWLSETATMYADLILPAATIEKFEGPMSAKTPYEGATSLRIPPIDPMFESKGEIDIYLLIAKAGGFLKEYITEINDEMSLSTNALATDSIPTSRDIFDAWAKDAEEIAEGVSFFETNGITETKGHGVEKIYPAAWGYFDSGKYRLYGDELQKLNTDMLTKFSSASAAKIYEQDYTAFPTWRDLTMNSSPSEYDLYLLSHKKIEFKQSRASQFGQLAELAPKQGLVINSRTAAEKGIAEGDWVIVESHNAVTGDTRFVKVQARLGEAIRPDTVSLAHHYGLFVHPETDGQGSGPNHLFFSTEGYVQMTMDQSFQVKVRVFKA